MKALLLGASLLLILPAAAAAQSVPLTPSTPSPPPPMRIPGWNTAVGSFDQMSVERERYRRDGGGTPAQRRERADRLLPLVTSGQCQAAHDAAVQEGDRIMAERIGEICKPSNGSTPAA